MTAVVRMFLDTILHVLPTPQTYPTCTIAVRSADSFLPAGEVDADMTVAEPVLGIRVSRRGDPFELDLLLRLR